MRADRFARLKDGSDMFQHPKGFSPSLPVSSEFPSPKDFAPVTAVTPEGPSIRSVEPTTIRRLPLGADLTFLWRRKRLVAISVAAGLLLSLVADLVITPH